MKNVVFWMLRRVALVKTDVSEERSTSIIRVTSVGELGTTLAVTTDRCTLRKEKTPSVLTTATRSNIPEDGILYKVLFFPPTCDASTQRIIAYGLSLLTLLQAQRIHF
jgi:hypothetical protein